MCKTFHQEQGAYGWQRHDQLQLGRDRHLKQSNLKESLDNCHI